ncbi:MAG: hypothetical protein ACK4NC_05095 [Candidatus Gracilibacteria bacterium]
MFTNNKQGSALAFSLLYIALMLILIIGISALVTRIFRINSYITQSVQAGYNSESAFELALYDLKMHREGYESTQLFQGSQINYPSASNLGYKIEYRSSQDPDNKITVPISNNKRQFALFFEDKNTIKDLSNVSLNYWIDGPLATTYKPLSAANECMELRLTGKNGTEYETVTAHVACPDTPTALGQAPIFYQKNSAGTSKSQVSLRDFISTHKENYMVANLISPVTSSMSTPEIYLHISSDTANTIASFNKTITTVGRYNNLEIKRKVTFPQDQSPDLLSVAIYQ